MIRAEIAAVTPRVLSPETGDVLPLDAAFLYGERLAQGGIEIVGGPGAGKTTALGHLAAVQPPGVDAVFLDEPTTGEVMTQAATRLVVYSTAIPRSAIDRRSFQLAWWGNDELIEYLLAAHPQQCRSVMRRLDGADDRHRLGGAPQLWCIVLDRMAEDPSVRDVRCALLGAVRAKLPEQAHRDVAAQYCLRALCDTDSATAKYRLVFHIAGCDPRALRLARHRAVKVLLAAEHIAGTLAGKVDTSALVLPLPRDVISATAEVIAGNAAAIDRLRTLLSTKKHHCHAMAASILHGTGVDWVPGRRPRPCLKRAHLEGASWPGANLSKLEFSRADLTAANLTGANLDGARVVNARLRHACLRDASLSRLCAESADFSHADLSSALGEEAFFGGASFKEANLDGARLVQAGFQEADLLGCRLCGADLKFSDFTNATFGTADFTNANLEEAVMFEANLTEASLEGARLHGTLLSDSRLEFLRLPNADFERTTLRRADLTGSFMPHGNFRNANLVGARLAEIQWEHADLREADLARCTFHMGTSRSGLVGSPIASEGSRTGFYTDEFSQQHYKRPEEIRHANLCGADLRGAKIEDVDFYLVDLRGAILHPNQGLHFRRCGAILDDSA